MDYDYGTDSDDEGELLDVGDLSQHEKQQSEYIVLSEADVRQRQQNGITDISTVLSVSKAEAGILLRHYNWIVSKVHEEWFADEDRVRKTVGIFNSPLIDNENTTQLTCNICFDTFPREEIYVVSCGHPFCGSCWEGYITTSINDGPGCLTLKCPEPGCGAAIGQDMVDSLVSEDDRKKYNRYVVRSYVEVNRKTKWCPAPGCDYAVDLVDGNDVTCGCKYSFCWNCTEETHSPVDCETVSKWRVKNSSESDNANWIIVNTKLCPKCKRPIEKNNGCMHMTCNKACGHQFCWLCLGPWRGHTGSYACNKFEKGVELDKAAKSREKAKLALVRYAHYYERWATNNSSRKKAVADLEKMKSVELGKISDVQCVPETQLRFLEEAWLQIVECRRVLKWTYAYGYYLDEEEVAKKQFFEYLQGEAEAGLERLHHCVEKELQDHLSGEPPNNSLKFNEFRMKLTGLTNVTRNYFENLVRALENGLSELDSNGGGSRATCSKSEEGGSGKKKRKRAIADLDVDSDSHPTGSKRKRKGSGNHKPKRAKRARATSTSSVPTTSVIDVDDGDDDFDYWSCDRCTYLNGKSAKSCQMCNEESV